MSQPARSTRVETVTIPAASAPTSTPVAAVPADALPARIGRRVTARHWVLLCSALALVPMIEVHMVGIGAVDPVVQPVSHYAFVPTGYWMILIGSLLLAIAASAIAVAMVRIGDRRLRVSAVLLVSFAVAIILVGIFPTDPPGTVALSASATLHRWAAAYSFAVLPVVGLLTCRSEAVVDRQRASLWRLSMAVCISTGVVFAIHLPLAVVGSHIPLFGAVERLGFVVMVSFMVVLSAMMSHRSPSSSVPPVSLTP